MRAPNRSGRTCRGSTRCGTPSSARLRTKTNQEDPAVATTQPNHHEALDAAARVPSESDLDTLSRQLNRPVRDVVEIGARCVCGNPLVATTAPRLSSGIPFPTTY